MLSTLDTVKRRDRIPVKCLQPAAVLLLWLGVMGIFLKQEVLPSLERPEGASRLFPAGPAETAGEEWLGIFFRENQVGYIHYSFYPRQGEGGAGSALEITAWLRLFSGGRENRVRLRGSILADTRGGVNRLELSASSTEPPISLQARGESGVLAARITAGGETRELKFPLPAMPLPHPLTALPISGDLRPGDTFTIPGLALPAALAAGQTAEGTARFEVAGRTADGWQLRANLAGIEGELTLDRDGNLLEASTLSGWALRRQDEEEAMAFLEEHAN